MPPLSSGLHPPVSVPPAAPTAHADTKTHTVKENPTNFFHTFLIDIPFTHLTLCLNSVSLSFNFCSICILSYPVFLVKENFYSLKKYCAFRFPMV